MRDGRIIWPQNNISEKTASGIIPQRTQPVRSIREYIFYFFCRMYNIASKSDTFRVAARALVDILPIYLAVCLSSFKTRSTVGYILLWQTHFARKTWRKLPLLTTTSSLCFIRLTLQTCCIYIAHKENCVLKIGPKWKNDDIFFLSIFTNY